MERTLPNLKSEINVLNLIENAKKFIESQDLTNAEYYLNLASLSPEIEFNSKIQAMAIRSYIHFSSKRECIVLLIANKILKEITKLKNDVETSTLFSFLRCFYRAGDLLSKNKKLFLSAFFFYKAKNYCESFESQMNNNDTKNSLELNLIKVLDEISNFLKIQKEKYLLDIDNRNGNIQMFRKIFLSENYSLNLETNCNSVYLVSTMWMNNLIYFLKKDQSAVDKTFERRNVCLLYFNDGIRKEEYRKYLGNFPGPINNYFITELKDFWFDPIDEEQYTNLFLRKDAKENSDFIYVNDTDFRLLKSYFNVNFEIERRLKRKSDDGMLIDGQTKLAEPKIEIHLRRIKILVLSDLLIDAFNKQLIRPRYIQISKTKSLFDLKLKILRCLEYESKKELVDLTNLQIRFIIPEFSILNKKRQIFEIVYSYTNKSSQFKLRGKELNDHKILIEDLKIAAKDLVIIEIKHQGDLRKNWFINLYKEAAENQILCSFCEKEVTSQPVVCDFCENYSYCSINCKIRDQHHIKYHENINKLYKKKIELDDIVSIDIDELISKNSKRGLTGLKNLGNTCFMNSALQCLSNSEELTKYFLLKKFLEEVNKKNKYGSGGQIAKAYYDLIKELWLEHNTYLSPWDFRQIFIGFVKQFAGFSQHDSHEMLAYMMDALHEDLNRVKEKPYFELKEKSNNETDEEASRRWWDSHLSRENSIIVDLFHGQYKSTITCPDCSRISITYDAFMHLGLPIPSGKCKAKVKFFPLPSNSYMMYEIDCSIDENTSIIDIKSAVGNFYFNYLRNCENKFQNNLTSEFNLEAISTTGKAFKKIIPDYNSNRHLLHAYENNNEIIVYQTELPARSKDTVTFYTLPFEYIEERSFFGMKNKTTQPIFYVKPFTLNANSKVYDLYISLFKYYRKIIKDINRERTYERFISNYENEEYVRKEFKMYFEDDSIPFKLFLVNNKSDNSQCEYCGKCCEMCLLDLNLKSKLGDIPALQNEKRPLLIYLEILNCNQNRLIDNLDMNSAGKNIFFRNGSINVYDCLDAFRIDEKLEKENSWYCSACKKHQEAFKKLEIYKPPNLLIIQFKRFKIKTTNVIIGALTNKKNDSLIEFPIDNLDLRNYVVSDCEKSNAIYDLYAISQHYGSLSSGHYTAVCRNRDRWYSFDDERVSRLTEENIVTSAAYLLFYKKRSLTCLKINN